MKDLIVGKLVSYAKKHPKCKGFIVGFLTFFLAVYHFGKSLLKNRAVVIGTFIILVCIFGGIIFYDLYSDPLTKLVRETKAPYSDTDESAKDPGAKESADTQIEEVEDQIGETENKYETVVVSSADFITMDPEKNGAETGYITGQDAETAEAVLSEEEAEYEPKVTLPYDSSEQWALVLFNKENPIPEDYEVELVSTGKKGKCDVRVKEPLQNLLNAAKSDGCSLYVTSAYRENSRQTSLYNRKVKTNLRAGDDDETARSKAGQIIAVPGTSEHEAGLAFDFLESGYSELDEGFEDTKGGKWLKENAADYGFILRYPKGMESVTGTLYEPWHYRYVGITAAHAIMENEITLEEYLIAVGE